MSRCLEAATPHFVDSAVATGEAVLVFSSVRSKAPMALSHTAFSPESGTAARCSSTRACRLCTAARRRSRQRSCQSWQALFSAGRGSFSAASRKSNGAADAEGSERMAGGLEDLRTRLKALPLYGSTAAKGTIKLLAHPGRLLRVLGSVCQLLGHVADDVDDAVAHCLNAARTALEGTHSSLALSLLGLPILSWLAARLASWCRQQPRPVTEGQVLYPHVVSSIALGSQTWSGGFSQPVPCRRASLCTAGPIPPESADEQSSADAVDSDWPPYESRSLGHVSDSEAVSPDLAKRRNLTPPRPRRLLLHSPGIQEVPESEKEMPPKAPKAVPLSKRLKRIDEAGEAIPLATRLQQRLAASREEAGPKLRKPRQLRRGSSEAFPAGG